jgi:predicted Fe-Mo cluster-binding NifX family protein
MIVAASIFEGRISPLFDVARHILLVEVEKNGELARRQSVIEKTEPVARAKCIVKLGVNVLICGAISRQLEALLASNGVGLIPNTCGPVEDVLGAFIKEQFTEQAFLMPGCCGQRRRFRGRRHHGRPWQQNEG